MATPTERVCLGRCGAQAEEIARLRRLMDGWHERALAAEEKLHNLRAAALTLDDAVAEFGVEDPSIVREAFQQLHDAVARLDAAQPSPAREDA